MNNCETSESLLIPPVRAESPARSPIFAEDVLPLTKRAPSPLNATQTYLQTTTNLVELAETPAGIDPRSITPDVINPLDRPSTPDPEPQDPFLDAYTTMETDVESTLMSRTTSHTLSIQPEDEIDNNSMSDWTEAFDNPTESEGPSDVDSDSDIISDAESEASWARIRSSRGVGYN